MGVFSALEDINTEELLSIVTECDDRAEKRVKAVVPKNAPDYRWLVVKEGANMFRRKLQLHEPTVIVPRKLIPDNAQVMAVVKPQLRPEGVPHRQQKIKPKLQQYHHVNLGRMWINDPHAPQPMQQVEAAPAEEVRNVILNYHEEVIADMGRVVAIAEDEIYQDPF